MAGAAFPMEFGSIPTGSSMNLVCKMKIFDISHERHLLFTDPQGVQFAFTGLLDYGHDSYTLLDVELVKQFPNPHVVATSATRVMYHDLPSWNKLHNIIDVCSGFGGMAQGSHAAGFFVQVAVDHNAKMLSLFQKQFNCDVVHGDVGSHAVIYDTWVASHGAAGMTAGFACQPYSALGDGMGSSDERSSCLSKVLTMAYFLRVHFLILECVSPAATNDFVTGEISHFAQATGFSVSRCELKLQQVWPTRRARAWWVLTSPLIGPVELYPWQQHDDVVRVEQVIPRIFPWDVRDEVALTLSQIEADAFGIDDGSFTKFWLDARGVAPCALHGWGNQLTACPCGCRNRGLSRHRLETKGLFGLLVRSAPDLDGNIYIRHVHPNECMALNAMDPVIDFGLDVRLTLCAVGQLASPLQSLWILGSLACSIDRLQYGAVKFPPEAQIQAFRSWLLVRCRQVWHSDSDPVTNPTMLSLMDFWRAYDSFSLSELLHLREWEDLHSCEPSIASVLDCIIRRSQTQSSLHSPSGLGSGVFAGTDDGNETPWLTQGSTLVNNMQPCPPNACQAFFAANEPPVVLSISQGSTVCELVSAQEKLTGSFGQVSISSGDGTRLTSDHCLALGHTVFICPQDEDAHMTSIEVPQVPVHATGAPDTRISGCPSTDEIDAQDHVKARECGPLPKLPVFGPLATEQLPDAAPSQVPDRANPGAEQSWFEIACPPTIAEIDPTATWTQPIVPPSSESIRGEPETGPSREMVVKPSRRFDVGECVIPTALPDETQSWISAAPLLALQSEQFVALTPPCISCPKQLWSLRHQFIQSNDRVVILNKQGDTWADDEVRFHLAQLLLKARALQCTEVGQPDTIMLDPLLSASWHRDNGRFCEQWCSYPVGVGGLKGCAGGSGS